jgi:hypothetical protein
MAAEKIYVIQFSENDHIDLELIEETTDKCVYKATKYNYDLELDEKSTVTFSIEVSPLTLKEKRSVLLYNMFRGKKIAGTTINITKRDDGNN